MDRLSTFCDQHALAPSVMACAGCDRPMCTDCVGKGDGTSCQLCAGRHQASRRRRRRAFAIAAVPVSLGAAALGYLGNRSAKEKAASRAAAPPPAEAKIACDHDAIFGATDGFVRMKEPRRALELAEKFFRQCGELPRLRWTTYTAHKQLGEWQAAADDASVLIASKPRDQDFWWWRAQAEERLGHPEKAAADYRQSIANEPILSRIPVNLYQAYVDADRACDAVLTLERYVEARPELKDAKNIKLKLSDARVRGGGCLSLAGKGTATLQPGPDGLVTGKGAAQVGAEKPPGRFVVDEGVPYLVLTRAYASKLGLTGKAPVDLVIGGVLQKGTLARVDGFELAGTRAADVEVAIVDELPVPEIDGLVGSSYLWRYTYAVRDGGITLRPRKR